MQPGGRGHRGPGAERTGADSIPSMADWREYQERVAEFFRAVGMEAETDVAVAGVRTSHDIDVLVKSEHMGIMVTWIVECKRWNRAVPKDKVLTLRSIVDDVGADRGFIMAESGFQSGALEAALLTNVTLTSLAEMKERLRFEVSRVETLRVLGRVDDCRSRYWEMPKEHRIDYGLRPDVTDPSGFSAVRVLDSIEVLVTQTALHGFPVAYDEVLLSLSAHGGARTARPSGRPGEVVFNDPEHLFEMVSDKLFDIENRLKSAELAQIPRGAD